MGNTNESILPVSFHSIFWFFFSGKNPKNQRRATTAWCISVYGRFTSCWYPVCWC
jgi:hypothetical protein